MKTAWYLGYSSDDIGGSALLVGDPDRIDRIAGLVENPRFLPVRRGLRTVTGQYGGSTVTAAAFGMGAPIATIVLHELANLGVKRFIRVGTALYLPPAQNGDLVLSEGILSLEGTSQSYVDDVNAYTGDHTLNAHVQQIAAATGDSVRRGRFATFDAFYRDMFPLEEGSVPRVGATLGMLKEKGVLAADMETSALVNAAHYLGVRFTTLCVATVNGDTREKLDPEELVPREKRMFEIALGAITSMES
jgi:uridine phosphorylase